MNAFDVSRLDGRLVRLERLSPDHADDLAAAGEEDRTSYQFTTVPTRVNIGEFIEAHLHRERVHTMVPFAQVRVSDGRAVGCTSYFDFRYFPDTDRLTAVMIGWTWLAASAQRRGINVESKYLLMTHAFEYLRVERVDLATDARNTRSRNAIDGLGATFEGVLRSWSRSHAPGEERRLRDTAMFSVVAAEWPVVRQHLLARLEGPLSLGTSR